MAKITPVLWTYNEDSEGKSPIYLRISSRGKTKYLSLGVKLRESQWNPRSQSVRKGHPRSADINTLIQERLAKGQEEILEAKRTERSLTATQLKRALALSDSNDYSGNFFA